MDYLWCGSNITVRVEGLYWTVVTNVPWLTAVPTALCGFV